MPRGRSDAVVGRPGPDHREPGHAGGERDAEPGVAPADIRGHSDQRHRSDPRRWLPERGPRQRPGLPARGSPRGRGGKPARDQEPGGRTNYRLGRGQRDEAGGGRARHGAECEQPVAGNQQPAKPDSAADEHDSDRSDTAGEPGHRSQLTGGGRRDPKVTCHARQDRAQRQKARLCREQAEKGNIPRRYHRASVAPAEGARQQPHDEARLK